VRSPTQNLFYANSECGAALHEIHPVLNNPGAAFGVIRCERASIPLFPDGLGLCSIPCGFLL